MSINLVKHLYHTCSDRELADRVLQGDREAFRAIVERTEKLVFHIICGMVTVREDREDLAQDIYLKAFRHLSGFRYEAKLSTWIARITYNTCANHLRKKRLPLTGGADFDSSDSIGIAADPFSVMAEREISDILQRAVGKLSPLNSTLITLYHQVNLGIPEIAHITGLPEGTVKSNLFRARRQLQQHLLTIYKNKEAL